MEAVGCGTCCVTVTEFPCRRCFGIEREQTNPLSTDGGSLLCEHRLTVSRGQGSANTAVALRLLDRDVVLYEALLLFRTEPMTGFSSSQRVKSSCVLFLFHGLQTNPKWTWQRLGAGLLYLNQLLPLICDASGRF